MAYFRKMELSGRQDPLPGSCLEKGANVIIFVNYYKAQSRAAVKTFAILHA